MSIQDKLTSVIVNDLNNTLDSLITKGLAAKGFTFNNKIDLYSFVEKNVVCKDDTVNSIKIYEVKGVPFFLYEYSIDIEQSFNDMREFKVFANYGKYSFL